MTKAAIAVRLSAEAREAIGAYLSKSDCSACVQAVDAVRLIGCLLPETTTYDSTLIDSIAGPALILDRDAALFIPSHAIASRSFARTSWLRGTSSATKRGMS